MPTTEILNLCLVALLSLDAEQQASEAEALLNQPFENTQFAACLRAHGVILAGGDNSNLYPSKKIIGDLPTESTFEGASGMMQMVAGGGGGAVLYPQ